MQNVKLFFYKMNIISTNSQKKKTNLQNNGEQPSPPLFNDSSTMDLATLDFVYCKLQFL